MYLLGKTTKTAGKLANTSTSSDEAGKYDSIPTSHSKFEFLRCVKVSSAQFRLIKEFVCE